MADDRRRRCAKPPRGCGQHDSVVGSISWRGLCSVCAERNFTAAAEQMHDHEGHYFRRWRAGMAACIGLTLDSDPPSDHTAR